MKKQISIHISLITLMALLLCVQFDVYAQGGKKKKDKKGTPSLPEQCFTLEELQQLLTMPLVDIDHKNHNDFTTFLTNRGYRIGVSSQQIDTVWDGDLGYVLLTYTRFPFNDVNNKESYVFVDVSSDSLSNVIHYRRSPVRQCVISDVSFHDLEYGYDNQRGLFIRTEPERFVYEAYCHNDSNEVVVILRDVWGVDALVNRKKQEVKDYVISQTMQASALSDSGYFSAALQLLDKLEGQYKPLDFSIRDSKKRIKGQFEQYWMHRLSEVVNTTDDVDEAIRICDTLLKYGDNKDTIVKMRSILVERQGGTTQPYSVYNQDIYDSVIRILEEVVNTEAVKNLNTRTQTLDLSFHFSTALHNTSSGSVSLSFSDDVHDYSSDSYFAPRTAKLQATMDSIARLPFITPVRRDGIIIATSEIFNSKVSWNYSRYEVLDSCNWDNFKVAPYVEIVDEMFFTGYKSDRKKKSRDGATISSKVNDKPTTALYTFGVNEKHVGDSIYTDVKLLDFKTSGLMSWTPSLIIPGVGTRKQGVISSAASRAVPFFLFGGLAAAGFILEGKNANSPGIGEGGTESVLERKGVGKIIGFTCIGIAGIIYLNDIVEGISAAVSNHKSAKVIRKELAEKGSIVIQEQPVKLK